MTEYKIVVGVGLVDPTEAETGLNKFRCFLCSLCGGYTEVASSGGWINEKSELVIEPGRVFFAYIPDNNTDQESKLFDHVVILCDDLQQACVFIVKTQNAQTLFI